MSYIGENNRCPVAGTFRTVYGVYVYFGIKVYFLKRKLMTPPYALPWQQDPFIGGYVSFFQSL